MIKFLEAGDGPFDDSDRHLLNKAEPLHRQLRPKIPSHYQNYLASMFADGAHLVVLTEHELPRALAIWRVYQTSYAGRRFYVDDLVTDEALRGGGWGGQLLAWLEERARAIGSDSFALDSGVQRDRAHRFYFRAGLTITSFSFAKSLSGRF